MVRSLRKALRWVTDDRLRAATIAGLASIPFTVASSLELAAAGVTIGESASGTPVFVAALLVGYLYADRPTRSRTAGVRTGLVGSIGLVAVFLADPSVTEWARSSRTAAIFAAFVLIATAIGVGVFVLVGFVGAAIGEWLAGRVGRTGTDSDDGAVYDYRDDGYWRYVLAYAVFAPLALGYVFAIDPDRFGWFLFGGLLLLALIALSVIALTALYRDATDLRHAEASWRPRAWTYVGVPLGAYAIVYAVATIRGSVHPPGDGVYGFLAGLWIASAVYLNYRHRYVGTP